MLVPGSSVAKTGPAGVAVCCWEAFVCVCNLEWQLQLKLSISLPYPRRRVTGEG